MGDTATGACPLAERGVEDTTRESESSRVPGSRKVVTSNLSDGEYSHGG